MKVKGVHAAPALIIVVLALSCAAGFLDLSKISGGSSPMLTITVLQLVIIGIPAVFFCLLRGHEYGKRLRLRLITGRHLILVVYSLILTIFGSMALSLLMYTLFPGAFAASAEQAYSSYSLEQTGGAIYAAISLAVLPAVLEEFLFRGIVSAEYSTYGAMTSVIMSALTFSMLHMNFVRMPVYLFVGIVLSLTAGAANSIYASMFVHAANNIFVLFFEDYIYKIAAKSGSGIVLLIFIVVTVLLIFATLFFGKAEKLYYDRAAANEPAPLIRKRHEGELPHLLQAVISPTFIILAVFFIIVAAVG